MAKDKYQKFLQYHNIDIKAIEDGVALHSNLSGLEDVDSVGALEGQALTKLANGRYGFTDVGSASTPYTKEETDALLANKINTTEKGAASGVATLDAGSVLPLAQLPSHNHDTLYYTKAQVDTSLSGKANSTHTHAVSDVTNLQTALDNKLDDNQLGAANGVASLDATTKVPYGQLPTGTAANTVAAGNDSRFTNSRTPTAHASTHASGGTDPLTPANIGAVATTAIGVASGVASLDTGTKVPLAQLPTGTTSSTVALGNHTHSNYQDTGQKGAVNGYASLDASGDVPIAQIPTGTSATTVAIGNDARLSDARTPIAHKSTHASGGSDALSPADIGAMTAASRGAANGVASLDGSTKVPAAQMPDSYPRGQVARSVATTNTSTIAAQVESVMWTITFTAVAGRRYEVRCDTGWSVGSSTVVWRLRWATGASGSVTGTQFMAEKQAVMTVGGFNRSSFVGDVTGIPAGQVTISLTAYNVDPAPSGAGTYLLSDVDNERYFRVIDIGV